MTIPVRTTLRDVVWRAQVPFVGSTLAVASAVLWVTLTDASVTATRFIHMTVGSAWIGIDLFLGVVLNPACAQLDVRTRAAVYSRLVPKLTVLLPVVLVIAIATGLPLVLVMKPFPHPASWLSIIALVIVVNVWMAFGWRFEAWTDWRWRAVGAVGSLGALTWVGLTIEQFRLVSPGTAATLLIGTLLVITGLGVILSGNLRICRELQRSDPDSTVIAALGQHTTYLARVQLLLLVFIVLSVVGTFV